MGKKRSELRDRKSGREARSQKPDAAGPVVHSPRGSLGRLQGLGFTYLVARPGAPFGSSLRFETRG